MAVTDFQSLMLPAVNVLANGEAGDGLHFETLVDLGPDVRQRVVIADKGYSGARTAVSSSSSL